MMAGQWYTVTMVILTILLVSCYILRVAFGSYCRNRLVDCVRRGDLETYEAIAAKKLTMFLVPPFNLHYMRLNLYMMSEKEKETKEEFDFLLNMQTGTLMRREIVRKAYYYFVKRKDGKRCKALLDEFLTFAEEEEAKECTLLYDIYILKKSSHIEELLKDLENLPPAEQAVNAYLVSLQYANQGKMDLAEEYEERSKRCLREALKSGGDEQEEDEEETK